MPATHREKTFAFLYVPESASMSRRLLLLSNSTNHGAKYLEHVKSTLPNFLGRLAGEIASPNTSRFPRLAP